MPTDFPTSVDNYTRPNATDPMSSPSHSAQHDNAYDAIEAIETKIGIGSSPASSATQGQVLVRNSTAGTSVWSDSPINSSMHRQAIMNGNFDVWQRGTSFTPATGDFIADRWQVAFSADGGTLPTDTLTRAQITSGGLQNSFYALRLTVNGAGSSLGTNSYYYISNRTEHGTRYLCGDGKKVTVSFWAKSDIAGKKLGIYLQQRYGTGGTPSAVDEITGEAWTLTSSWTKYTHTFTTATLSGKTFGTANDDCTSIVFGYMFGTGLDQYFGESGAEDFGGSGTVDIAQVQMCAGEVDLPFQPKSMNQELLDCYRYYERPYFNLGTWPSDTYNGIYRTNNISGSTATTDINIPFKVTKRVTPTSQGIRYDLSDGTPVTGSFSLVSPAGGMLEISLLNGQWIDIKDYYASAEI